MALAWHTAWLHRVDAKKFPKLDRLLAREPRRKTAGPQTPDQMLALARMITAALGGELKG